MKKKSQEKPGLIGARVYKRHRVMIRVASRKLKVSQAEVIRRAIEAFVV
jgi:hypothetical protein